MTGRRRHLAALTGMLVVPLALLSVAGARLVGREQRLTRQTFEEATLRDLRAWSQTMRAALDDRERRFLALPESFAVDSALSEQVRQIVRHEPFFRAALVLDRSGRRLHPPALAESTTQERAFLVRARALIAEPSAFGAADAPSERDARRTPPGTHGWNAWYDGNDLDLCLWRRLPDGRVIGVEVDRARLLADVIDRLPEASAADEAFALLDARGEALHRWGSYEPQRDEAPIARLSLARPLAAWQLVAYAPARAWNPGASALWLFYGLAVACFGAALGGLAFFLHREHLRGLRLAEQRVSFVNRVSHELKTPLTNIRLYAELLEQRLEDADEDARRQAGIVVAEGQRLGRLIDNVLTFGRQQRGALRLRSARGSVDAVVARVVERLTPALAAKGIEVSTRLAAAGEVLLDSDALTQILENLLSNVEKYAAAGGGVRVETRQEPGRSTLVVSDRGPGIPRAARERVFQPFERLADSVTEAAQGTGIGLAIVRDLARLHGGDAVVREAAAGAVFEVSLSTPAAAPASGGKA